MKTCPGFFRAGQFTVLGFAIVWFILIELFPAIKMPEIGWSGDEFIAEVETLKLINNMPDPLNQNYITAFGRYFPIAINVKDGALESYLMLPFLFFGGATLPALRIGHIFWGVAILVLTYYFGYRFFNSSVGILAAVLLATNASFINSVRTGGQYGYTIPVFSLIALIFFLKWDSGKRDLYFNLGMFSLGLGFNARGVFVWLMASLFVTGGLLYLSGYKIRLRIIITGLGSMILSLAFILYFYTRTGFYKNFLLKYAIVRQEIGNNLRIAENLHIRLQHLNSLLAGPVNWGEGFKIFPAFSFWFCLIWFLFLVFVERKTTLPKKRIAFILTILVLMFLFSMFAFTRLREQHLWSLLPYPQIFMAAVIFEMFRRSGRKLNKIIISLLFFILVSANTGKCFEDYLDLKIENDNKAACNISLVTDWLLKNKIYHPVCFYFDVWLGNEFYSNLKIAPRLLWSGHDDFLDRLKEVVADASQNDRFIFDFTQDKDRKEYETFKLMAKELNREIITNKEFLWQDGTVRFIVHSLK